MALPRALCRIAALGVEVDASIPPGKTQDHLVTLLDRAATELRAAQTSTGHKGRRKLKKARALIERFEQRLASRATRHLASSEVVAQLRAHIALIRQDVSAALAGG
jgi:hypothetical protein